MMKKRKTTTLVHLREFSLVSASKRLCALVMNARKSLSRRAVLWSANRNRQEVKEEKEAGERPKWPLYQDLVICQLNSAARKPRRSAVTTADGDALTVFATSYSIKPSPLATVCGVSRHSSGGQQEVASIH